MIEQPASGLGGNSPRAQSKAKQSAEERAAQQAQALKAEQWMQAQLRHSIAQATKTGWILDCETTVKVLYGHQDGAVVSYNPQKPGMPSHIIHTYWIGNLRLVLDTQLQAGNRHSPSYGRTGLKALLQSLSVDERPKLVRGDSAYGSEGEMLQLEELQQPYLFKLRQTAGVKQLIKRQWRRQDWCDMGQGWTGCEDELRLSGWSAKRRVIVMRRQRKTDLVLEQKSKNHKDQIDLLFIDENEPIKSWEYAVLVSNARVNKIVLALTHEAATHIKSMLANARAGVEHIRSAAPQLMGAQRWYALARYIADKILAFVPNTSIPAGVATG